MTPTYEFLITAPNTPRELTITASGDSMPEAAVEAVEKAAERHRVPIDVLECIRARQIDD